MILEATTQDFEAIIEGLYRLYLKSIWAKVPRVTFSREDLFKWLVMNMTNYDRILYVKVDKDNKVVAALGVFLLQMYLPPHLSYIDEWVMFGDNKRSLGELWEQCKIWGEERGALVAVRGAQTDSGELRHWEAL